MAGNVCEFMVIRYWLGLIYFFADAVQTNRPQGCRYVTACLNVRPASVPSCTNMNPYFFRILVGQEPVWHTRFNIHIADSLQTMH